MKKRYLLGAGIAALMLISTACSVPGQSSGKTVTTATRPATSPAAAPEPSPDGKYHGSCDYTLADSYPGNSHLVGEIDVRNTGNVGIVLRTKITWPQEGMAPIVAHRTVRVAYAKSKAVRFSIPVSNSGNVIDLLQSWQEHHGFRDGCTYNVKLVSTFGQAH